MFTCKTPNVPWNEFVKDLILFTTKFICCMYTLLFLMLPLQTMYCGLLKDFTCDFAVVSIWLHDVTSETVALVRAWTVDAQVTANTWVLTLIIIGTG